jgi:hypothetical protein
MLLSEMFEPAKKDYQDQEDDKSRMKLGDFRKTRLTLRQINKLRRLNDIRKFENFQKKKLLKQQYSPPAGGEMGGNMGGLI